MNAAAAAATASQTAGLLSALSQLNVTPQQAIGGAGAMLGLAKNRLSSTDYSQLTKSVPGIDHCRAAVSWAASAACSGRPARRQVWTMPWAT